MAVLIDTDVLVAREHGGPTIGEVIGDEEWAISVVTVSELLHGVHRARGGTRTRRQSYVEALLGEVEAIPITVPVARVHAQIWARLAARGESVGVHDLWIAATALAHGLGVATGNAGDFHRVPGLRVVTPPS